MENIYFRALMPLHHANVMSYNLAQLQSKIGQIGTKHSTMLLPSLK